jgi:hypothetical protein
MALAASPVYDPVNKYKPFGPDIGIVDGPLEYMTIAGVRLPLAFPTRMTVVRLKSGDLFLHSPIVFNPTLVQQLQGLGSVRHLVSPNQFHYAHIGEWARAFPDAVMWASPHVRERARARGIDVQFNRDLAADAPDDWRDDIEQCVIPGGYFGEFAFFHKRSKTLVFADTMLNLELDKLGQPWRFATWLTGMYYPDGGIFFGMRLPLVLQKRKTKAAIEKMLSWQPERIILSHGRCFETNGSAVLRRAFPWAL